MGGFFHETHTFLDGTTPWNAFDVVEGKELLALSGESSPLGGALELAAAYRWRVLPTIFASAVPSATVSDDAVERYWRRFVSLAEDDIAAGVDAIFLILHGAFVSESFDDVEGELLSRIRALPGARLIPVFGVYDLHANFSLEMAKHADCLVAYRENPHSDARESAQRAISLLQRCLIYGVRPKQVLMQAPIIWPPTGTATATDPMRRLLQLAREMEQKHENFWCVNVNAGFAYSDTVDNSVSFTVATNGDEETALASLDCLVSTASKFAFEGNVREPSVDEVLLNLRDRIASGDRGLTVIAEPSDNIGGGAPGDGTGLLRGLLKYEIPDAAVCIWDPMAVEVLQSTAIGAQVHLVLGGRGSKLSAGPIELVCRLVYRCAGRFELEDKNSHLASMCGDHFDMGDCAVVCSAGVTILLTSRRTPPMDLGQWRHVGIHPEAMCVIGVKAAVAHRKAYASIATYHDWVDTPGPCQSRLCSFPYVKIRRPIYPLDAID